MTEKPKPMHYSFKLMTPLCDKSSRTERTTPEIKDVTCKNCLGRLADNNRISARGIDWQKVLTEITEKFPAVRKDVLEFLLSQIDYKGEAVVLTYPSRISLSFYIPKTDRRKRQPTRAIGVGNLGDPMVDVHQPTDADVETIATYVGQLADQYNLRAYRESDRGSCRLSYKLLAKY